MNNCFFNNPRPIFCPFVNFNCTQNQVINPTLPGSFAYLTAGTTEAAAGANIPLTFENFSGNLFLPNGFGGIVLSAGTYEITYTASGSVPSSGSMAIGLNFAGVDVSTVSLSQAAGSDAVLVRTFVLTVSQSGTLYLKNTGAQTTTFSFASMLIKPL